MKKILLIAGAAIGVFALITAITFVMLTIMLPDQNAPATAETPVEDQDYLAKTKVEIDSLVNSVNDLKSQLFFADIQKDSLIDQLDFKEKIISGYELQIADLNDDLLIVNKKKTNIKELAKTYESMKLKEMQPILSKIDDNTLIAIYQKMSSRNRKNLILALKSERAALITQQLAGITAR